MKENGGRVSAHQRLITMPPVIQIEELSRTLTMPRAQASLYAHRWKQAGLLSPLGGKVGVWFNLIADREGPRTRRAEAVSLLLARPALVVGGKALHAHGWTTQRHTILPLAVPIARESKTLPKLDHGIELLPRSLRWFRALAEGAEPGIEGFMVARPEMALADALLSFARRTGAAAGRSMTWQPTMDEICFDDDERDARDVISALGKLGASKEEISQIDCDMSWNVGVDESFAP